MTIALKPQLRSLAFGDERQVAAPSGSSFDLPGNFAGDAEGPTHFSAWQDAMVRCRRA